MKNSRWPLILAFVSSAIFVITLLFVTVFVGQRLGFLYGRVPGFSTFRAVVQWAGLIVAAGFVVAAAMVAISLALQPGSWLHKALSVLPVLLLLFAIAGIVSTLLDIGTVGIVAVLPGLGPVTFATAWLILGAVLAAVALVVAVTTTPLGAGIRRAVASAIGLTALAGAITALAMIAAVAIVASNQPATPSFGGFGRGGAPGIQVQPGAGEPGTAGQAQQGGQEQGRTGQGREGGGGEGFRPGGEGGFGGAGGLAVMRQQFMGAGALMVIAALALVYSALAGLARSRQATGPEDARPAIDAGREAGRAVFAATGVSVVALILIQLIPVSRTNPPVQTTVSWDSAQTQQLWNRACADCHSNQTEWPWYTDIAPSSWLTVAHVNSGRQQLNVSDVNTLSRFARGAEEAGEQIRSGNMPPQDYLILHPAARLTDAERLALIQGLQNSLGQ